LVDNHCKLTMTTSTIITLIFTRPK